MNYTNTNFNDYDIYLDEGYCIVRSTGQKVYAEPEILQYLQREQWRLDKSLKTFYTRSHSYNITTEDGTEFIEFLPGLAEFEPEHAFDRNERLRLMMEAIERFPARTREIGILYFFNGLTEKKIADRLGISHQVAHYQKNKFIEGLHKDRELMEWLEDDCLDR